MKKHQKIHAVNDQEDEDCEVYILYPENATIRTEYEIPREKYNPDFDITIQQVKNLSAQKK